MNNYEIFCKTVELGSLSHTAKVLNYSQSNITHVIQQLEKNYGFTLLVRNKGGVALTENGKIIYEKMKQILKAEQELQKCVREINHFTLGSLRIGVFSSVAAQLLPKVIKNYNEKYPNVEITLYDGDHEDVENWLLDGSIDLGFLSEVPRKNMEFIPLMKDEMLALLPVGHPLCTLDNIPVERFRIEPTIYPYESVARDVDAVMKASSVTPNKKLEVKGSETIVAMVREGLGISMLPELYLKNHTDHIEIRHLTPRFYRTIGVALPRKSENESLTKLFLNTLKEVLKM